MHMYTFVCVHNSAHSHGGVVNGAVAIAACRVVVLSSLSVSNSDEC